jgi:hypothetical protein
MSTLTRSPLVSRGSGLSVHAITSPPWLSSAPRSPRGPAGGAPGAAAYRSARRAKAIGGQHGRNVWHNGQPSSARNFTTCVQVAGMYAGTAGTTGTTGTVGTTRTAGTGTDHPLPDRWMRSRCWDGSAVGTAPASGTARQCRSSTPRRRPMPKSSRRIPRSCRTRSGATITNRRTTAAARRMVIMACA